MSCWIRLGLEPTQDLDAIRLAYRTQLPSHHPETDPEGFQALRSAYEEALRLAREHEALDTQAPVDDATPTADALHPTLQAFHHLLEEPSLRFDPQAWQTLIDELDELPLEQLDDVSWQILGGLRDCGPISHRCVGLLATRLGWADQLLRMENPQEVEALLQRLQVPDPFDTVLMRDWPPMLQMEALWYFRSLEFIFQSRPLFEFEQFVEQHTCVAMPNDPTLIERLYMQLSMAGIASPTVHAHWQAELKASPDDPDLLYLVGRQAELLGDQTQALTCNLRLLREHDYPQAERWLLEYCARHQPQWLPLLIQSLDQQPLPDTWPTELSDPLLGIPAQNPQTLARWSEASREGLGGIAATFIDWRLDGDDELPLLAWLLDEQDDALLHRRYWQAWALQRGEAGLLQQIISATPTDDALDALILEGFQRQANQQLHWLCQSEVAATLTEYSDRDDAGLDLPGSLLTLEVHPACREWLRRMRVYSAPALLGLNRQFQMRQMFTVPFAMALQGQLAERGIVLPPMPGGEALWDWHRQQLFMLAMLDQPARWMELVSAHVSQRLHYPPEHPFHGLHQQLISAQAHAEGGLLQWLDHSDPVQEMVAGRLLHFGNALELARLPSTAQLYACLQQDTVLINDYPFGYSLLCAVLLHDLSLDSEQRAKLLDRLQGARVVAGWFDGFRKGLIEGKPKPPAAQDINALGLDSDLLKRVVEALDRLINRGQPPSTRALRALQRAKDDEHQNPGLRCAIMAILSWSERMLRNRAQQPAAPAWQAWKLRSRLDRKGYALTLGAVIFGAVAPGFVPDVGIPVMLGDAGRVLIVLLLISALLRRMRDLDQGVWLMIGVLVLSRLIPFLPLVVMALPGDKLPNQYGPPPGRSEPLQDGLQAALRRLNGQ
ncbi:DUF805 domain-containing protein [Pseudomonas cremoricolorata]|uniref:Molecular chaperone DnaJ n=1 Tax=Pseudomonas cremoricolorata TaxID=157783 RepID=A0A089WMN4_9PSED|nr:DUF805 domain-containing protein [Pseudomonas cremoricolorata]AIR89861.1 hypothetical protein LK03_11420 [Pseudomonas cremoricolorata]